MSLRNVFLIWKRDLKGYFYTPLAYIFLGMVSVILFFMFWAFLRTYMVYTQQSMMGMAPDITIDKLTEAFYGNMHVIMWIVLPFFTMRLFTEESRQNTLVLLMTSPVRMWELTLAKFAAGGTMLLSILAITFVMPLFLFIFSAPGPGQGPDMGIVASTYLGLLLSGLTYVAVGAFWSSITDSQLIALALTFLSNMGFWLVSMAAQGSAGAFQSVLKYLAINEHFSNFLRGTIETKSIVYCVSLIFVWLFLTNRSLASRAWRS